MQEGRSTSAGSYSMHECRDRQVLQRRGSKEYRPLCRLEFLVRASQRFLFFLFPTMDAEGSDHQPKVASGPSLPVFIRTSLGFILVFSIWRFLALGLLVLVFHIIFFHFVVFTHVFLQVSHLRSSLMVRVSHPSGVFPLVGLSFLDFTKRPFLQLGHHIFFIFNFQTTNILLWRVAKRCEGTTQNPFLKLRKGLVSKIKL